MAGRVPAIHVLAIEKKGVDARVKPGHDESVARLKSRRSFHRSGSVLPPHERSLQGRVKGGAASFSASSWPGLSRPSTSWQIEKKGVDARVKPGHDESVARLKSRQSFHRSGSMLPPPERS